MMRTILLALSTALFAISAHAATGTESARFEASDRNKDGKLDRTEFRGFIQALASDGLPIAKRVVFWRVYGLAFRITDKNKDGQLTPAELQQSERENRNRKRP